MYVIRQEMTLNGLFVSLAGCGVRLYRFLIIAFSSTLLHQSNSTTVLMIKGLTASDMHTLVKCLILKIKHHQLLLTVIVCFDIRNRVI